MRGGDTRRRRGFRQGGARAYGTTALESGWIAAPVPAIYSGAPMKAYREHLSAASWEASASLAEATK